MFKKSTVSFAALAASLMATSAWASDAAPEVIQTADDQVTEVEAIEVVGFRNSLARARTLKRSAVGARETILAEDVARFPDLNLAEALQRIPGVTITRDGGEGRQISLRGLGSDFAQVQLNGMEALGTSSSAMDSRGAVNRSRAFDFDIFASELFNRVDVMKSFSADMDEGGIGGTVGLMTPKPFDREGLRGAMSVQLGDNSQTHDVSPRVAGLVSNTWGHFGALVSVAYSRRDAMEMGYDTVRWRRVNAGGGDISALSAADQDLINNKQLWFPRGARPVVFLNDQERLGLTGAFEYRPNDSFRLGLDVLYGTLKNSREEYHIQHGTGSSTGLGCSRYRGVNHCSSISDLAYNDRNQVTHYSLKNTTLQSETKIENADSTFSQVVLSGDWTVSDRLRVTAMAGRQVSEFVNNQSKVYMRTIGDMTLDFTDGFYGRNSYGFDITDPKNFTYSDLDIWQPEIINTFDTAKFDVDYDLTPRSRISAGASFKRYENEYGLSELEDVNKAGWESGALDDSVDPSLTYVNRDHGDNAWLSVDVLGLYDRLGINRWLAADTNKDFVTEETSAAYVQYEFSDIELAAGSLRGAMGLRYYDTTVTSEGALNGEQVSLSKGYSGVLPTLNLAWDLGDWVLRANASKNMTRPSLGSLNAQGNVQNDPTKGDLTVSAGNPGLQPLESINYDIGAEWYFPQGGYLAVSYFKKDLKNLIGSSSVILPYGEIGYPLDFLGEFDADGNPQTADTLYRYVRPSNIAESEVQGAEIALQHNLTFLPAPFDQLGLLANYTYADGDALYENVFGTGQSEYKSFPGLSRHSGNVTLFYETPKWGARLSGAYRSAYIQTVQSGNTDEDERGFHATTFVDVSAFYNLTDRIRLSVEGINLTDQAIEQYSDSADRLYSSTTSGRSLFISASYTF